MLKRSHRTYLILVAGLVVCGSACEAKDKKVKAPPSPPKDEIEVVGQHVPLVGGPVTRFSSTQHYSSYYLYAEHGWKYKCDAHRRRDQGGTARGIGRCVLFSGWYFTKPSSGRGDRCAGQFGAGYSRCPSDGVANSEDHGFFGPHLHPGGLALLNSPGSPRSGGMTRAGLSLSRTATAFGFCDSTLPKIQRWKKPMTGTYCIPGKRRN